MSQVTILVAEDFARFRELVRLDLERRPEFRVVTVADGLAAVEKVRELRPDLVVLDVGLPALDGLAAARRIRSLSPTSRIVFLTQESAPEIVDEALTLGSDGFIHKPYARHLLPTVDAILDNRLTNGRGRMAAAALEGVDPTHHVQFCSDERTLLETGEHFLASALNAADAAIVIATRSHLQQFRRRLERRGGGVARAIEQGSFVIVDAEELAARILSEDATRWQTPLVQAVESAAAATKRPGPRVAVFGECAGMLWGAGHVDAAIALEQFGVDVAKAMPVDILCTYSMPADRTPADDGREFESVCALHTAIAIR